MQPLPLYLAGDWRQGRGGALETRDPHENSMLATLSIADRRDIDEAVQAGRRAMDDPAWRDLPPHRRALYLHRIAALIDRDAERLAQLQRQDNGKPILETRALVASAAGTFRYFAAACETMEGAGRSHRPPDNVGSGGGSRRSQQEAPAIGLRHRCRLPVR